MNGCKTSCISVEEMIFTRKGSRSGVSVCYTPIRIALEAPKGKQRGVERFSPNMSRLRLRQAIKNKCRGALSMACGSTLVAGQC